MTKRNKIIFGSLVSALIIFIIIFIIIWLWQRPGGLPAIFNPPKDDVGLQIPANLPSASAGLPDVNASIIKEVKVEANIKAIATTFSERFGSYSNQGNYSNLDSLMDISSRKMKVVLENSKIASPAQNYSGIMTQALIVEVISFDENTGRSEVKVTTKRQESTGSTLNPTSYYQDLNLKFVKEEGAWKVDAAEWGAKK